MGHRLKNPFSGFGGVSVSALSDHLMGPEPDNERSAALQRFSIRSFGSFDGTFDLVSCVFPLENVSVSALSDHLMGHPCA